jgi:hypothetical protein
VFETAGKFIFLHGAYRLFETSVFSAGNGLPLDESLIKFKLPYSNYQRLWQIGILNSTKLARIYLLRLGVLISGK